MKELKDYDWEEIQEALGQYADHLEENEPYAENAIAIFRQASERCPLSDDFE
ncbi:hypothetical protein [Pararhizobium sp.]|uniref:hypothetical protein n=1 Tax=Pararhizobium sp. TaxID=1977563 RepID=UPI003D115C03